MILEHPIVDSVLSKYARELGDSAAKYRNHVMRSLNYYALLTAAPVPDDVALAWAVHDLGIWTAGTWDYIAPSAALATELAPGLGIDDSGRAESMVIGHHRVVPFSDPEHEAFRRADLIDFSHGILRLGVGPKDLAETVKAFPYLGFHRFLARNLTGYALKHPLRPFPMMRLRT